MISPLKKVLTPKYCKQCGEELSRRQNLGNRPYCSMECSAKSKIGKATILRGVKRNLSQEVRKKLADGLRERNKQYTKEQRKEIHNKMVQTRKSRGYWQKETINRTEWNDLARHNEDHPMWKGDDASYSSKHKWVYKNFNKTGVCEDCGVTPTRKGSEFGTHWHNIDKGYKRERKDWVEVCQRCHIKRHNKLN